jgi:hypothetical protein
MQLFIMQHEVAAHDVQLSYTFHLLKTSKSLGRDAVHEGELLYAGPADPVSVPCDRHPLLSAAQLHAN